MVASIIILALGAVMSCVFIVSKVTNYTWKTIIFKTIASLFFVALGIVCCCLNNSDHILFKVFTVLGLFFGLLGDVFLGFKYITTKTKKLWILLGGFTFGLGHIFYTIGLLTEFYVPGNVVFIILPFVLPIAFVSVYLPIAKKVGIKFEKGLIYFAIAYIYCLTTVLSSSLSMVCLHRFSLVTLVMFFIGAINFACSDFMLTGAYFKPGKRPKAYNAVYSVFYYIAQFVIAFSIFFLV